MVYIKLIISGSIGEFYQYEKTPYVGIRKGVEVQTDLALSGQFAGEANRLVKRQDSAIRAKVAFARLCLSNFVSTDSSLFCSFTFKTEQDLSSGYRLFNLFAKRMRYSFSPDLRYIAVPEFGSKGTKRLHFHAFFWGLPLELAKTERKDRVIAKIWEYGFVHVELVRDSVKSSYYLAKYLSKNFVDSRFFNRNSYVASRNIRRPVVITEFSTQYANYVYDVDNSLDLVREYDTLYLGRCIYKRFKIDLT